MEIIDRLLPGKKLRAAILASTLALIGFLNGLPLEAIVVIIAPLGGFYIIGQGIADNRKEAAKIEAQNGQRTWIDQSGGSDKGPERV